MICLYTSSFDIRNAFEHACRSEVKKEDGTVESFGGGKFNEEARGGYVGRRLEVGCMLHIVPFSPIHLTRLDCR